MRNENQNNHQQTTTHHSVADLRTNTHQAVSQEQLKSTKPKPVPNPLDMIKWAKTKILHQDHALKELCVQMYYHLKTKASYSKISDKLIQEPFGEALGSSPEDTQEYSKVIIKAPIFITGKTGSGKTHLIKTLCQMFDVNFVSVNATHISNAGHKGTTLANIGEMLLNQAKDTVQAQFSVVFFDEFDKLFISDKSSQLGLYHLSLVTEILTIMEGTTNFPVGESEGIESENMLFILGGSFNLHGNKTEPIGFTTTKDNIITPTNQNALTRLGLPDELVGRIGKVITMNELDGTMLKDILQNSPTSPYTALKKQLALENCTVTITEQTLDMLLDKQKDAIGQFGVRGLYQGFYEHLNITDILLEATIHNHHHFVIDLTGYYKEYYFDDYEVDLF